MKQFIYILCAAILFLACEKEKTKSEPADFHGTWVGTWTTSDNLTQGNFMAPASQQSDKITGEVFVNILLPEEEGFSPEYTGTIDGDEARVLFSTSGIDIQVKANQVSSNTITGTFVVPGYYDGTFEGSKYPLVSVNSSIIYTDANSSDWYEDMFIVNNQFWLVNVMTGQIEVIDQNGKLVETHDSGFLGYMASCYDGNNFWVYNLGYENPNNAVYKITHTGEALDSILLPEGMVDFIHVKDDQLYFTFFAERTIYSVVKSSSSLESTNLKYFNLTDLILYKEGFLVATGYSPYLIYIDHVGNILNTYHVGSAVYALEMDDSGEIYCFTDEVVYSDSETLDTYQILKLELND